MSKKLGPSTNFRVVITPRRLGNIGCISTSDSFFYPDPEERAAEYRSRCKEIAEQVRRHVDSVGDIEVECDRADVCEHCGWEWTETDPDYNGGCCEADQSAYEAKHGFDASFPNSLPTDIPTPKPIGEQT